MSVDFTNIENAARILDGLTLLLMTCAEKGDLPAEAYVEGLELANMLAESIHMKVAEVSM